MLFWKFIGIITTLFFNLQIIFTKELYNNVLINNDSMAKILMNILDKCFPLKLDMVTVAGDLKNFETWHNNFPPKLLIFRVGLSESNEFQRHRGLKKLFNLTETAVSKLYYPSKIFIVFSPTPWVLKNLLKRMKKSVTWKSSAIFFFVNDELKSCDLVDDIFREAWKMNIYNAAYVCLDKPENIEFFSFNPFKNASSGTWRFSHFTSSINNDISWIMTIFRFPYNAINVKSPLCPNPEFVKTQDLNNYPVMLGAVNMPTFFEKKKRVEEKLPNSTTLSDYKGLDAKLWQIMWSHLKAQPILSMRNNLGYIDKNNALIVGLFHDVIHHEFDMILNTQYIGDFWRFQTFPRDIQGVCLITLSMSRQPPPFDVILFDFHILWRILLLGGAAVLALVYVIKMSPGKAFLEVLQRLLNMTSNFQPEKSCFKRLVYVYVAFNLFFYNLQLNSSITSSRYNFTSNKMPQNFEGFFNAGYTLQGPGLFSRFLGNDTSRPPYIISHVDTCMNSLHRNNKLACTSICKISYHTAPKILKVSEPVLKTFVAYYVRRDWPLLPTVNKVIHGLVQAGILKYFDQITFNYITKQKYQNKQIYNRHAEMVQPVAGKGLTYIFCFLIVGQLLAFLIFLLEYCLGKFYTRKVTSKKLDNLMILRYIPRKRQLRKYYK